MKRSGLLVQLAFALAASLLAAAPATAATDSDAGSKAQAGERRVALVIGNSEYATSPLKNPVHDARAMAEMLKGLGFEVTLKENVNHKGFIDALRVFGTTMKEDGVALFYYAGHGMQVRGRNFLIPVDADVETEDEIQYSTFDANRVLDKMEQAKSRLNIVILDACRNNPFARSFRSNTRGLAQMDATSGTIIAFATSPGSVASDGDGDNGIYTKHLLRNLPAPGVPVEIAFKRVREAVIKDTGEKQIPWESSSLLGDFYFNPSGAAPVATVAAAAPAVVAPSAQAESIAIELAFWESIKSSKTAADYKAYLEQFPKGRFAPLARNRLAELDPKALAAKTPEKQAEKAADKAAAEKPAVVAAAAATTAAPSRAAVPTTLQVVHEAWPKVGDSWTYNISGDAMRLGTVTFTITAVTDEKIEEQITREGAPEFVVRRSHKTSFDQNSVPIEMRLPGNVYLTDLTPYLLSFVTPPAREWELPSTRLTSIVPGSGARTSDWDLVIKVGPEEKVKVPAGTFQAVRIDVWTPWKSVFKMTYWYSQQAKRLVKMTRTQDSSNIGYRASETLELAKYSLK